MLLVYFQLSMIPLLHTSDFTYKSDPVKVDAGLYAGQLIIECAPVNKLWFGKFCLCLTKQLLKSYCIPVREFLVDGLGLKLRTPNKSKGYKLN